MTKLRKDRLHRWQITNEELKLAWGRIDTNGDGSISLSEMQDWWSQVPSFYPASLVSPGSGRLVPSAHWALLLLSTHRILAIR